MNWIKFLADNIFVKEEALQLSLQGFFMLTILLHSNSSLYFLEMSVANIISVYHLHGVLARG